MKINSLTASFGMLKDDSIHFHDGLNVIYSPNESGKSTWCAFILAMLYGVDSSSRQRTGMLPDKTKYSPWSGAPMEGTMELSADRCDITLQRTTRLKSAPMREFTAVYTGTNNKVAEMTGTNAGEMLTGVNRDVFCRTAFIGQGGVTVTGSPELEKRINSIVASGEEQISYSEADKRLRDWQHKRRYNSRGMIPNIDAQISEQSDSLHELEAISERIEELEFQLSESEKRCMQLEQAVADARKKQRKQSLGSLNAAREVCNRLSAEHDNTLSELSAVRSELRSGPFGMLSLEEAEERVNSDLSRMGNLTSPIPTAKYTALSIVMLVLALTFAGIYSLLQVPLWASLILVAAAVAACAVSVALILKFVGIRRDNQATENEYRRILRKYRAASPEEITAVLEKHCSLWEAVNSAELREKRAREAYEAAAEIMAETERTAIEALDFNSGNSAAADYSRSLNEERRRASELRTRAAGLRGRAAASGDPVVARSCITSLREKRSELQNEYDAISLACDVLREADAELQNRFSPELSRVTAQYMRILTGGRYSDVFLDKNFSAAAKVEGDIVARDSDYLSAGTIDLLYLAVRLAVCEIALPDGEPCPLIIDDALVNLDPERFAQAMKLLAEIAEERQVILFTCREK